MVEIEETDADDAAYGEISYDECAVNDFCLIESGEDEKWQGQVKAKNNGKLLVRWLRHWVPKTDEEDVGQTGLYEWDPYKPCEIEVGSLIEIGPTVFHKARRPGFEPKRQVYCLAATCNGRCALSFPRLKAERVTAKEDMTFKAKKPRYLLPVPDGHVDWQPNVVGEFKPTDTEIGNPFVYATERSMGDEYERRPKTLQCYCDRMRRGLMRRLHTIAENLHDINGGCCPSMALATGRVIPSLQVKKVEGKGFGVFARETIQKGAYLFEYIGEIIGRHEAAAREFDYASKDQFYMHDIHGMARHESYGAFTVDPTRRGNLARFLNHSCEPNTSTLELILSETLQEGVQEKFRLVPRICFLAINDIEAGEELCIDYVPHVGSDMSLLRKFIPCKCGASTCRGWVF